MMSLTEVLVFTRSSPRPSVCRCLLYVHNSTHVQKCNLLYKTANLRNTLCCLFVCTGVQFHVLSPFSLCSQHELSAEPCWLLRSHLFRLGSVIDGKCRQTDSAGTAPKALHNFLLPLHVNQQYLDAMNFELKLYTHLPTLYSSPKTAVHNVHVRLYVYMTNMYIQGNELSFLSSSSWSWVKPF